MTSSYLAECRRCCMLRWLPRPCPPATPAPFPPGQPWLTLASGVSVNTGGLPTRLPSPLYHLGSRQMPSTCWKHHKGEKERWFSCRGVRSCQLSWPSNSSAVDMSAKDKTNLSPSAYCLYSCPVYQLKQVQCLCRRSSSAGNIMRRLWWQLYRFPTEFYYFSYKSLINAHLFCLSL